MSLQLIETNDEFNELLGKHPAFFLLKHSITCPISAEAKQQYEAFSDSSSLPTFILHVQEARPLSNTIAENYEIKHESPQALFFQNHKVVWDTSHWDVTKDALKKVEQQYA